MANYCPGCNKREGYCSCKPRSKGRPKYAPSKDEMTKIKELFEQGATIQEVSDWLGINPSTFYELKKRDEDFANEVSRSKALYKQSIRRSLTTLLKGNNPQVAIHLSKSVLRNIESQKIDANINVSEMSDTELEEAVRKILAKGENDGTGDNPQEL